VGEGGARSAPDEGSTLPPDVTLRSYRFIFYSNDHRRFRASQVTPYLLEYAAKILDQVAVPETAHTKAILRKPGGSLFVGDFSFGCTVLAPVQFDNQLCIEANEIHNVGPDRLLAAEFEIVKSAIAQRPP
jgi:hypothetical protein